MKKIAIACDHGGYELKLQIIKHLEERGFEVCDFGCDSTKSVDYPDYALPASLAGALGNVKESAFVPLSSVCFVTVMVSSTVSVSNMLL